MKAFRMWQGCQKRSLGMVLRTRSHPVAPGADASLFSSSSGRLVRFLHEKAGGRTRCRGSMQRFAAGCEIRSNSFQGNVSRRFASGNSSSSTGQGKGPISWVSFGLIGAISAGSLWYYTTEKEKKIEQAKKKNNRTIGKALLGGQWTLVDHTGRPVTDASLKEGGHTDVLLYFGFTFCPDICPAELIKMKEIIDRLDNMDDIGPVVRPVFITCDPKRDGVAQIAHYVKDFHPRMLGLTGTPEQISTACKAFRVYHSIADQDLEDEDDYNVDHSIVMYHCTADGEFLDFYTQMTEADEAVERIRNQIIKRKEG